MTNPQPSSPLNNSVHDTEPDLRNRHHFHHDQSQLHPQVSIPAPTSHSNDKMKLIKSNSSPVTSGGDLPPLVGVPQDRPRSNHRRSPDTSPIPASCREARESESPVNCSVSSPLRRRRLKYMVRQSSDSELLNNNILWSGHLRLTSPTNESSIPIPHPPDQSHRSQNSSGSNSPRGHRGHSTNPPLTGPTRHSRSLDASPLIVRRALGGVRRSSCEPDYTLISRPSSPSPGSDKQRRLRPLSFGSVTDALRQVNNASDPSIRGLGSPFAARRFRGGILQSSNRPDTPANDVLSVHELWKLHQLPTSSGERVEAEGNDLCSIGSEDCCVPLALEEASLSRRRPWRESGSNQAQRRSNCTTPTDCKVDDDTGHLNALYDIQERRESMLSMEAVQEIARRFVNSSLERTSDKGTSDNEEDDSKNVDSRTLEQKVPDYRKDPLPRDTRVANWLKGIPDPTEKTASSDVDQRILPDII